MYVVNGCWSVFFVVFFFKQKTAYEMRISDWSSDVCSSDLCTRRRNRPIGSHSFSPTETRLFSRGKSPRAPAQSRTPQDQSRTSRRAEAIQGEIGRASCRERVCQYV